MHRARAACVVAIAALAAGCWLTSSFDDLRAQNAKGDGGGGSNDGGGSDSGRDGSSSTDGGTGTGCIASSYVASVLADTPLDYYRFDDAVGSPTAKDSAGTHSGTFQGVVGLGVPGILPDDTAATFDGETGYVVVTNGPTFNGKAPFTLEAWINPTKIDTEFRGVMSNETPSVTNKGGYTIWVQEPNGGTSGFGFERWANGSSDPLTVPGAVVNAWSHVVASFDGSTLVLYVNGVDVGEDEKDASIVSIPQGYVFVIGALNSGMVASFFSGIIDEVAIYDHPLTARCVLAHYHLGLGQPP